MINKGFQRGAEDGDYFEQAIEKDPAYALAYAGMADSYNVLGFFVFLPRLDEAMAEFKRALELDPLSLFASTEIGWVFYFTRQYDQALERFWKTLEMDPNFLWARLGLGVAYSLKGMHEEAIAEWQKLVDLTGRDPIC